MRNDSDQPASNLFRACGSWNQLEGVAHFEFLGLTAQLRPIDVNVLSRYRTVNVPSI